MRYGMYIGALLSVLTWAAPRAAAQTRVPVRVVSSIESGDNVGAVLVTAVRNGLAGSAIYSLNDEATDSGVSVYIVTMDPTDNHLQTVASVVYTLKLKDQPFPFMLDQQVLLAGQSKTESQAKAVIANLDNTIVKLRRLIADKAPEN